MAKSKTVGLEHVNYDDRGNIAGLWQIDGNKVREHFGVRKYWQGIDEIIKLYTEMHPNEMAAMTFHNKLEQNDKNKDTGASTSGSYRHALSLPYNLLLVLKDYDKNIISDKKKRTALMKRFPNLRACKVV